MKPLFMSWKDYAKSLEVEIKKIEARNKYFEHLDTLLGRKFIFFDIETAIEYVKTKAKLNIEFAAKIVREGDSITPRDLPYADLNLRSHMAHTKKTLLSFIEENKLVIKELERKKEE